MKFQTAFLINLDTEAERCDASARELAKVGLPFKRFSAVRYEGIPTRIKKRFLPLSETVLSEKEIACFASHLLVLELISAEHSGFFSVCEDDLVFECERNHMQELLSCFSNKLDWDLIRPNLFPKGPCIIREEIGMHKIVDFFVPPVNAEFYFVQPCGARKVLEEAWAINMPFDVFLKDLGRWKINSPGVLPPLTRQRAVQSTIDPDNTRNKAKRNKKYSYRKSKISLAKEASFIRKFGLLNSMRLFSYYGRMCLNGLRRDTQMKYVIRLD